MAEQKEILFAGKILFDSENMAGRLVYFYLGHFEKEWRSKPIEVERALRLAERVARRLKYRSDKSTTSATSQ